eukprot:TRINITY_DN12538_c0_g1_i1.p1 TRINITY_DN12538_c0_g1~~TRINITY_DN12538_c0_g1_i1.p1  ORF type:complete len:420 (-),score=81.89 TRINITY_DN12538_c0_g1_i1:212-1471(-)
MSFEIPTFDSQSPYGDFNSPAGPSTNTAPYDPYASLSGVSGGGGAPPPQFAPQYPAGGGQPDAYSGVYSPPPTSFSGSGYPQQAQQQPQQPQQQAYDPYQQQQSGQPQPQHDGYSYPQEPYQPPQGQGSGATPSSPLSFGGQPPQADPNYYNPVDLSSPLAQLGMQGAKNIMGNVNVDKYTKGWLSSLKFYFGVNTEYVLAKLRILTFPFLHKSWSRRMGRDIASPLPPSHDINAPDLYIPLMAFVTYVLFVGFFMGTTFSFTPDILGMTASTGFVVLGIEVLILWLSIMLFNFRSVALLELFAYCGYKFVSVNFNIFWGFLVGNLGFYISYGVNTLLLSVFMVKTFRILLPKDAGSSNALRNYFLLMIVGLQWLSVFFLCYLDFQSASLSIIPSLLGSSDGIIDSDLPIDIDDGVLDS